MTTNAGASDLARAPMGFGRSKREGDDTDAINRMFTPEFRNRLDATIAFSGLPPEIIMKVVEKFVFQLEAQLADRGVTIELSEEAAKWLAETGFEVLIPAERIQERIDELERHHGERSDLLRNRRAAAVLTTSHVFSRGWQPERLPIMRSRQAHASEGRRGGGGCG